MTSGRPQTEQDAERRAAVERLVREVVLGVLPTLPPETVVGPRSLKELGADSVDRVEIIAALVRRAGIDEPLSAFNDIPHTDGLVDFLTRRLP